MLEEAYVNASRYDQACPCFSLSGFPLSFSLSVCFSFVCKAGFGHTMTDKLAWLKNWSCKLQCQFVGQDVAEKQTERVRVSERKRRESRFVHVAQDSAQHAACEAQHFRTVIEELSS